MQKTNLKKETSYCICLSCEYILKEVICVYVSTGPKAEVVGAISVQEFQENVFVEGNRPKYVLDLHTEAQQGLKMQQQEGQKSQTSNQCLFKLHTFTLNQTHAFPKHIAFYFLVMFNKR